MVLSISTPQAAPLLDLASTRAWAGKAGWPMAAGRFTTTTSITTDCNTDVNAAWRPLKPPKPVSG